jgi:hypothetical protein
MLETVKFRYIQKCSRTKQRVRLRCPHWKLSGHFYSVVGCGGWRGLSGGGGGGGGIASHIPLFYHLRIVGVVSVNLLGLP